MISKLITFDDEFVQRHPLTLKQVLAWEQQLTSWHMFPKSHLVALLSHNLNYVCSLEHLCWTYVESLREAPSFLPQRKLRRVVNGVLTENDDQDRLARLSRRFDAEALARRTAT